MGKMSFIRGRNREFERFERAKKKRTKVRRDDRDVYRLPIGQPNPRSPEK